MQSRRRLRSCRWDDSGHRRHFPARWLQWSLRRLRGYGYGYGGVGVIGIILIILVILVVMGWLAIDERTDGATR